MAEALHLPDARADMIAQSDCFADEWGNPVLAVRFQADAEATFKTMARTFGLGRPRSFGGYSRLQPLRSWKVGCLPNHVISHRPLQAKNGDEIVRALHDARTLEKLVSAIR